MTGTIILRFVSKGAVADEFIGWRAGLSNLVPKVTKEWILDMAPNATPTPEYTHMNVYHVPHIEIISSSTIRDHLNAVGVMDHVSRWSCHIYKQLQYFSSAKQSAEKTEEKRPALVVSSGFTIKEEEDVLSDFHKWYTEEHMPGMATIPGWRAGTRYELLDSSGDSEDSAAKYIALHEWDEPNGLGSDIWKSVVFTPWTEKILETQTAPMQRSTWTFVE